MQKQKTILCIDDDPTGLHVRRLLLETAGYRVLDADHGKAGIELFKQDEVDLVVLDYLMPEMSGGEVAAVLKSMAPQVPIVLLSAYVEIPSDTRQVVDVYVRKGQDPNILLNRIAGLLNGQLQNG